MVAVAARVAPARVAATKKTAARAPAARMVATRTGAARPCRLWQTVGGLESRAVERGACNARLGGAQQYRERGRAGQRVMWGK